MHFFLIFEGISVAKNCLRPKSAPLKDHVKFYVVFRGKNTLIYRSKTQLVNIKNLQVGEGNEFVLFMRSYMMDSQIRVIDKT